MSLDKQSRDRQGAESFPLAYLITFTCYGTWLHGERIESVDRDHNVYEMPFLPPDARRAHAEQRSMPQPPYRLDSESAAIVLRTLQEVCLHRGWSLLAAHVRPTHIHAIVRAPVGPERIMTDFKAYSSRRLAESGSGSHNHKRWTRHGSTRYLWTPGRVDAAMHYVVHEQGEPLAVYPAEQSAR